MAHIPPHDKAGARVKKYSGISPNYRRDLGVAANLPEAVNDKTNTSLWITELPLITTYSGFLAEVRNKGPVKSLHINGPSLEHPNTSAAKLVFFEHQAAAQVLAEAARGEF
ncbi:Uu.00g067790.m01.CDS01 [Anthostomella pinea]|uniref:Uu.00g067790.m01.CDS01 n=1 Tax=Anthostomella pinea TaxID=933095 RepID=A0AAI8VU82_9PEZI|nr:Uu.00g067790.m01.CDS01 [Anthostomella pinea]